MWMRSRRCRHEFAGTPLHRKSQLSLILDVVVYVASYLASRPHSSGIVLEKRMSDSTLGHCPSEEAVTRFLPFRTCSWLSAGFPRVASFFVVCGILSWLRYAASSTKEPSKLSSEKLLLQPFPRAVECNRNNILEFSHEAPGACKTC